MSQSAKLIALLIASMMGSSEVEGQENNLPKQTFQRYISLAQELGQEIEIVEQRPIYKSIPLSNDLLDFIWDQSKKYGIEFEIVLALLKTESNFNPKAVSYNNTSRGITQLNSNTYPWIAKELGIKNFNVYNPYHNIKASVWYLNYLKQYWIDRGYSQKQAKELMLLAYNKGIGNARKHLRQYGSGSNYTTKIFENKNKIIKGEIK